MSHCVKVEQVGSGQRVVHGLYVADVDEVTCDAEQARFRVRLVSPAGIYMTTLELRRGEMLTVVDP